MFPKAAAFASNTRGKPGAGSGIGLHRHRSRVRGAPEEWQVLLRLLGVLLGQGPKPDVDALEALVIGLQVQSLVRAKGSPIEGRDAAEILAALAPRVGPDRLVDLALRTGPYGDGFGAVPDGLTLDRLAASPHGIDLGPLESRIPELLRTPSGRIELAPELLLADMARLAESLEQPAPELLLVGRRHVRSNNSWMHNLPMLAKGPARCTLQLHPDDAAARGLANGDEARVTSRVGSVVVAVEVTDAIRPGVVSLPHGWGHDEPGTRLAVAAVRPGANSNVLTDELALDPLSGTSVLNGIPVEVRAA
jgi:hypothetical protein